MSLPTHLIHRKFSRAVLGKDFQEVNSIMDAAAKYVPNPSHRDYGHSMPAILGLFADNPDLFNAAVLHLLIDNLASADPEFHRMLKIWVNLK